MEWMILPYQRYVDFSGRSQRKEYWMFQLFNALVSILLLAIMLSGVPWSEMEAGGDAGPNALFIAGLILLMLFWLGSIIPHIAVTVRRLHDQDKSGWLWLLNFIPYIGPIILLVFMCLDGTPGDNQYGPDPKGRHQADIFA